MNLWCIRKLCRVCSVVKFRSKLFSYIVFFSVCWHSDECNGDQFPDTKLKSVCCVPHNVKARACNLKKIIKGALDNSKNGFARNFLIVLRCESESDMRKVHAKPSSFHYHTTVIARTIVSLCAEDLSKCSGYSAE